MYEYEFRLIITLPDLKSIFELLKQPTNNYNVKYIKHFRCKGNLWEFKKKLREIMVYHVKTDNWIKFVESKEIPFHKWKKTYYNEFKQHLAFKQNIFDIEYRYEIQLDENAKLYGYNKNYTEFGLVFELEVCNVKTRSNTLPIDIKALDSYKETLNLFYKRSPPAYTLHKCRRKPVLNTNVELKNSLKAIKHDGIFGQVYSYQDYIYEEWEDGEQILFRDQTLGDGIVYGAEKLDDNKIILLYVAQVRGLEVFNVFDILLNYLTTITANAPTRYHIQYYYEKQEHIKKDKILEGIVYHTKEDKIYKIKKKHTLDLLYENGFFVTTDGLIQCYETNLENGMVYECDLNYNVIKPRYDRFLSNTPKQIKQILKCSKRKLSYSYLFKKPKFE